jgi:DNA invertase Pin-like site-specific DNA recombinase
MTNRTIAYVRVSTEKQDVENQISQIKTRLGSTEFEIRKEIMSGGKELTELKKLVTELKAGDVLVVGALDRLGRNLIRVVQILEELNRKKVKIISVREGVDFSTDTGKFIASILASTAELEKNLIGDRTSVTLKRLREEGKLNHRPCKYTEEQRQKAVELHNRGMSIRRIAAVIDCSVGTVLYLLKSPPREKKWVNAKGKLVA